MRATLIFYAVLAGLAVLVPFSGIYPVFVMKLYCFALFAAAFNLLLGFTKMLSFGHAAYFGAAGYATGWLTTTQGWGTIEAIVGGIVVASLLGLVIGAIAIRRQGIYFAMITLALAQIVYFVCLQGEFSGGENGLQSVPRGSIAGLISLQSDVAMYYFVLAAFAAAYLFIRRVVHSPFGQVLKAIRENEPRAISLGYKVDLYKLVAFVLSAGLAGLAGSLKTLVLASVTLTDVSQGSSGEVILMTLLGGIGTFFGPVVGAGIITTLQDYLSDRVGSWVTVIMGAIFIACVMAFRRGVVGEYLALARRRRTSANGSGAH